MERTESIVIQVAPDYENAKIKEMEMFGWNLQNRQEIHERGNAYSRPSHFSSKTYIVKTTVYHYVKLHFSRSVNLPNLDKIKQIEEEYFNLPFPSPPAAKGPVVLFVFGGITTFQTIVFLVVAGTDRNFLSSAVMFLLLSVGLFAGAYQWLKSRRKVQEAALQTCRESEHNAEELVARLKELL